nr:MAG TPA_asm: hypothetical protein [Caudoviricetes sp.]
MRATCEGRPHTGALERAANQEARARGPGRGSIPRASALNNCVLWHIGQCTKAKPLRAKYIPRRRRDAADRIGAGEL